MSSDGPGREDDQAGDDEKRKGDKRPHQKKITFQDLFGISPEEVKQVSENFARMGSQFQETFSDERFKELQKRQNKFARDVTQAHDRLAAAVQALAQGASEAQQVGDAIAKGLFTLREDLEVNLPPQELLADALAEGYRQAQRSKPIVEDDEQALDFLVEMASSTWEQLREKIHFLPEEANRPSEEDFVEAVVSVTILIISTVVSLPVAVVVLAIYHLAIHPQIEDRYKT